jgi:hypothetical protein
MLPILLLARLLSFISSVALSFARIRYISWLELVQRARRFEKHFLVLLHTQACLVPSKTCWSQIKKRRQRTSPVRSAWPDI